MASETSQFHAIEIAEKVSSILSVVGATFVIGTFSLNKRFRKPINRLVFYASFGNILANVGTLISRSGLRLGATSGLCQFQALLIQWFMPADALWTFAMACNVWLTFFHQYDATSLRRLEWKYILGCYGLPFIPAITYLFVQTAEHGRVYGSAVLWCWVSSDWNALRIATFYGPVWLFIVFNIFIYIKVGMVVFKWRNQLISSDHRATSGAGQSVAMRNMPAQQPQKSYEVQIHSQVPHDPSRSKRHSHNKIDFENELRSPTTPTHNKIPSMQERPRDFPVRANTIVHHPTRLDANKATLSYCYTALLFFIALLVTWVPSTVNRLYTLIKPGTASPFGLDFSSALVLPLQGFWNCVIYIYTSRVACSALLDDFKVIFSRRDSMGLDLPKHNRRKRGSQPLGSTDTRADIIISMDGKNRIVHHRSEKSSFSNDDTVPEMVPPSQPKMKSPVYERNSSFSDATTAHAGGVGSAGYGHSLQHTHSQRSHQSHHPSYRSMSRGSNHIVEQMDVQKHTRMESEDS